MTPAALLAAADGLPKGVPLPGWRLSGPVDLKIGSGDTACKATIEGVDKQAHLRTGPCPGLFGRTNWEEAVTAELSKAATCEKKQTSTFTFKRKVTDKSAGTFQTTPLPGGRVRVEFMVTDKAVLKEVLLETGNAWAAYPVHEGALTLGKQEWSAVQNTLQADLTALAVVGQAYRVLALSKIIPPSACEDPGGSGSWCVTRNGHEELICYDGTSGSLVPVRVPTNSFLRPNRGIRVLLRHCKDTASTIALDGTAGTFEPLLQDRRQALSPANSAARSRVEDAQQSISIAKRNVGSAEHDFQLFLGNVKDNTQKSLFQIRTKTDRVESNLAAAETALAAAKLSLGDVDCEGEDCSEELKAVTREQPFLPRMPGRADLKLTLGKNSAPLTHELSVLRPHAGAIRVGLAAVFGDDAAPETYAARTPPGSSTQVLHETAAGGRAVELVLGVAPYFFDLLCYGGRTYERRDNVYVAPFIGFGVVSLDASGLDSFKSLHLGLEAELIPQLSVGLTWVIRRVDRLANGLMEYSPTTNDQVPMKSDVGFGVGLVINATPEIFKFGVPGASNAQPPSGGESKKSGEQQ
jgi:hypothetical protein